MTRRRLQARLADDSGMVTVEAAIALSALVTVVVLAVFGIVAVAMHLRSIDAAREAARVAAQGDSARATAVGRSVAPRGASIDIRTDGEMIRVRVRASAPMLPIDVGANAMAVREPSADDE
jgi:Flp pilus assembly protein TadG